MIRTISPKQAAFVGRLVAERDASTFSAKTAALLAAVEDLTARDASALIDLLLATPRVETPGAGKADPGYYVTDAGDVLVVVLTKDKQRTYAKRLEFSTGDSGRKTAAWVYAPGVGKTLAGIAPLTVEQAALLGHKHGFCVVCAKALTDPKSVERGIGPVCVKRLTRTAVAA